MNYTYKNQTSQIIVSKDNKTHDLHIFRREGGSSIEVKSNGDVWFYPGSGGVHWITGVNTINLVR